MSDKGLAHSPSAHTQRGAAESNARLVAELQAVTLGIHLVGLDRLPEVMRRGRQDDYEGPDAGMHDTEIADDEGCCQ